MKTYTVQTGTRVMIFLISFKYCTVGHEDASSLELLLS